RCSWRCARPRSYRRSEAWVGGTSSSICHARSSRHPIGVRAATGRRSRRLYLTFSWRHGAGCWRVASGRPRSRVWPTPAEVVAPRSFEQFVGHDERTGLVTADVCAAVDEIPGLALPVLVSAPELIMTRVFGYSSQSDSCGHSLLVMVFLQSPHLHGATP